MGINAPLYRISAFEFSLEMQANVLETGRFAAGFRQGESLAGDKGRGDRSPICLLQRNSQMIKACVQKQE